MIKKLRLTNFKGVEQGEVGLSPLTILVGSNNSGKSTILEALFLAPNPARQVPYGDTAFGTVQKLHQTLSSQGAASLLLNYRAKYARIECEIDGDSYYIDFIQEGNSVFLVSNKQGQKGYTFSQDNQSKVAFAQVHMDSSGVNTNQQNLFIGDSLLIDPALIKIGYQYLYENWASIMNSGACQKVIREVSELSNEAYINITLEPFLGNTYAIYAFLKDGRRIRLGDLGEGIQSYIIARLLYEIVAPEVLLWDDIESHLNPRMLVKLAGWFSDIIENGKQIVLTTHSIETVKILAEANPNTASVLLTSLRQNILKTRTLSIEEINNLSEAGIDVRMAEPFLL
jgi:predicted ATPase